MNGFFKRKILAKWQGYYLPNYFYDDETGDYMSYDYMCMSCKKSFKEENVSFCPHCGIKTRIYEYGVD